MFDFPKATTFAGVLLFAVAASSFAVAAPATVTLPEGQTSATITVSGQPVTVQSGDTIETDNTDGSPADIGSNSNEIIVTLSDGSAIAVTPGASFSFSISLDGIPTVNLKSGSVRVVSTSKNTPMSISSGGTTILGTDISAQTNSDGSVSVGSNSGTAAVFTASGGRTAVRQGYSAQVSSSGSIQKAYTPLTVGSTALNTTVQTTTASTTTTSTTATTTTPVITTVTVVENSLQDSDTGSRSNP